MAWNIGFALNFEFQASESLRMGIGAGYTQVTLPAEGAIESPSIGSSLAHLWLDFRLRSQTGGTFVPRLALGVTSGGSSTMNTGYLGFGGAFPQGGWGVHVSTGPQWLGVYDREVKSHTGWGWQMRLRFRRTWFDCHGETEGTCD
jgi:hypothetical protein